MANAHTCNIFVWTYILLARVAGASCVLSNGLNSWNQGVVRPQRFEAVEVLSDAPALWTNICVCDLRAVVKPELPPPIVTLVPP